MTKKQLNESIEYYKEMKKNEDNIAKVAGILQITEDDPLKPFVKNVLRQLGDCGSIYDVDNMFSTINSLESIAAGGIDGGYKGFVYIKDTCEFFDNNKEAIFKLLDAVAEELGYANELEMINDFDSIKKANLNVSMNDIVEISNNKGVGKEVDGINDWQYGTLKNSLAWYAGEAVANKFNGLMECKEDIKPEFMEKAKTKLNDYANKQIKELKKDFEKSNANTMSM